jgi:hypothetical protein
MMSHPNYGSVVIKARKPIKLEEGRDDEKRDVGLRGYGSKVCFTEPKKKLQISACLSRVIRRKSALLTIHKIYDATIFRRRRRSMGRGRSLR